MKTKRAFYHLDETTKKTVLTRLFGADNYSTNGRAASVVKYVGLFGETPLLVKFGDSHVDIDRLDKVSGRTATAVMNEIVGCALGVQDFNSDEEKAMDWSKELYVTTACCWTGTTIFFFIKNHQN